MASFSVMLSLSFFPTSGSADMSSAVSATAPPVNLFKLALLSRAARSLLMVDSDASSASHSSVTVTERFLIFRQVFFPVFALLTYYLRFFFFKALLAFHELY